MTDVDSRASEVRQLLIELHALLDSAGESNWRRGVDAAIGELTDENGGLNTRGFDNARSIFNTMTAGGRGFAEYYVWKDDEDQRIAANKRLDELRTKIWAVFEL